MNDTADVDIAAATTAAKQQIDAQRAQEADQRANDQSIMMIKAQNAADNARIAEDERKRKSADKDLIAKQKAASDEATRKAKAEANIRANAEAAKNKQEARDALAEAKKLQAAKDAEKSIRDAEEAKLAWNAKTTSAQRIAARNKLDAMNRAGNGKPITPDTIRDSIRAATSKPHATLSSTTTGLFGGISESILRQPAAKESKKYYKIETQAMSKAVKSHMQYPVTGTKTTPRLKGTQVAVSPGYVDALLGRGTETIRTHDKKSGGLFGGLNDFVKRI